MSLDPLAVEFPAWSAYNYVLGNPVLLTDPDGNCPACWGAIVGGGVELVSQMVANAATGKPILDIDYYDVVQSSAFGALTAGFSVFNTGTKAARTAKTVITIVDESAKAGTDIRIGESGEIEVASVGNGSKDATDAAIEATISVVGAKGADSMGETAGNLLNTGLAKEAKAAGIQARGAITDSPNKAAAMNRKASTESTMHGNVETAKHVSSIFVDSVKDPVINWAQLPFQ